MKAVTITSHPIMMDVPGYMDPRRKLPKRHGRRVRLIHPKAARK